MSDKMKSMVIALTLLVAFLFTSTGFASVINPDQVNLSTILKDKKDKDDDEDEDEDEDEDDKKKKKKKH